MSTFTDYLETVKDPAEKTELARMCAVVHEFLPEVEEGISYGMPAFFYDGHAFLSFAATKKFLSLYPFSGQIITDLKSKLKKYGLTKGSIHFSVDNPIPDELLREIIMNRIAMIRGS
jgi:uncharacterized protein YdhG (YjbR/CyaY superfamily)